MDRLDLTHVFGTRPQRRWASADAQSPQRSTVEFGRLADGRWYAVMRGRAADADDMRLGAYVYAGTERGQQLALRLAYRWMTVLGGRWFPEPASVDGWGKPRDGLPWRRSGGRWLLGGQE